jgi:hypothetical protein
MTEQERQEHGREILAAIRRVLYREWDPLDICDVGPEDRYDNYISGIYRLLATRPTRDEITQELKRLQVALIGPDYSKEKRLHAVSDALLAINVRLEP